MARALRVEYSGALYHVTSRGNRRQRIFDDDREREHFLALVGEAARLYGWLISVYVLRHEVAQRYVRGLVQPPTRVSCMKLRPQDALCKEVV